MKRNIWLNGVIIIVMLLTLLSAIQAESVPNLISYQGVLKDSDGNPVVGPVSMTFSVYNVETEGEALWSEDHTDVALDNGVYNVLLGDGTTIIGSFDINLFSQDNLWLEVIVNGEVLTPRISFTSSAFGFKAAAADTAAEANHALNADSAQHADTAGDADTVDGAHAVDLEESAEIDGDIAAHTASTDAHHSRYTNQDAVSAMGTKRCNNPLNHPHRLQPYIKTGSLELAPGQFGRKILQCADQFAPDGVPIAVGYTKTWNSGDKKHTYLLDVTKTSLCEFSPQGYNNGCVDINWISRDSCMVEAYNNAGQTTGHVSIRCYCLQVNANLPSQDSCD